jgi:iron(III) transport system ATP-binding protein
MSPAMSPAMSAAISAAGEKGLKVEGLRKEFGGVRAVDGISFAAGPGEFISLLGPSGCGKTTTLRCIAGFEQPQEGRIALNGQALTDAAAGIFTPPHRRRFGMVFQSYAVWPHMTVFENVAYPLKVQGGMRRDAIADRVRDKLKMVGLIGLEQRYPANLSGGQQQRVALARAIVMEPLALLFDEPLSNLDAKLRERMRFELLEIQSKLGVPAVYVTHDQAEAMVMSHKIIVMKDGHIAQSGPPEDIYEQPVDRFVADFVGNCNFVDAEVVALSGSGTCMIKCAFGELRCLGEDGLAARQRVLLVMRPERVHIAREQVAKENAFRAIIRGRYFMGFYREYLVEIGTVTLRVQTNAAQIFQTNERVHAHIAASDCKIIPAR